MKKLLTLFTALLITMSMVAQVPNSMTYQAVIRDTDNELVKNSQVGMRISILFGAAEGEEVYTETLMSNTNTNGLVTVEIGGQSGFDDIDWAAGAHYIKVETDPQGGSNYTITAVTPVLQVPYALYAQSAFTADYDNLTNLPDLFDGHFDSLEGAPQIPSDVADLTDENNLLLFHGSEQGEMIFWDGSQWASIQAGATGQVLILGANGPIWSSPDALVYVLTLAASPMEGGTVTGAGQYQAGAEVPLTAVAEEEYNFERWESAVGTVSTQASITYTMPAENTHLTAVFSHPDDVHYEDGAYGEGVTDIDGNSYLTVYIGEQEWMAENLRTTRYNNGDSIDYPGSDNVAWRENTTGAYAWNQNNIETKDLYGAYYNWYAASNENLCPQGWRVPNRADWNQLISYIMEEYDLTNDTADSLAVGNALKDCRQVNSPLGGECTTSTPPRWNSSLRHYGTDDFNFSAIGPGNRHYLTGGYTNVGGFGDYWTSEESSASNAWRRNFGSSNGGVFEVNISKNSGYSVRCVRDLD